MCAPMAIFGLLGAVVSGLGAMAQAKAQQEQEEYKAKLERRQAMIQREAGAFKGRKQADEVKRALGKQRAGYASSGLALEGSPAMVIEESAEEGALDVAAIRWNSNLQEQTHEYNAKVHDMNAKAAKQAAAFALLTPIIGGVAKMGGGFSG